MRDLLQRLAKMVAGYGAVQWAGPLLSLIFTPIITRILSVDDYGASGIVVGGIEGQENVRQQGFHEGFSALAGDDFCQLRSPAENHIPQPSEQVAAFPQGHCGPDLLGLMRAGKNFGKRSRRSRPEAGNNFTGSRIAGFQKFRLFGRGCGWSSRHGH